MAMLGLRRHRSDLVTMFPKTAALLLVMPVAVSSCGVAPIRQTSHVLVGADDIASCNSRGDERTALLLDEVEGTNFTAGDNHPLFFVR